MPSEKTTDAIRFPLVVSTGVVWVTAGLSCGTFVSGGSQAGCIHLERELAPGSHLGFTECRPEPPGRRGSYWHIRRRRIVRGPARWATHPTRFDRAIR